MRRTVGIEVAATAVILGLSAVLVQVNPGRSAGRPRRPRWSTTGVSQTLTSRSCYTLQFNIYPVELGENNTIHAFVYTPAGKPLPAEQWTVTSGADRPEPGAGDRADAAGVLPRHHAVGAITFPLPGTYELSFTVRVSEIDQATVRTTITVPAVAAGR